MNKDDVVGRSVGCPRWVLPSMRYRHVFHCKLRLDNLVRTWDKKNNLKNICTGDLIGLLTLYLMYTFTWIKISCTHLPLSGFHTILSMIHRHQFRWKTEFDRPMTCGGRHISTPWFTEILIYPPTEIVRQYDAWTNSISSTISLTGAYEIKEECKQILWLSKMKPEMCPLYAPFSIMLKAFSTWFHWT